MADQAYASHDNGRQASYRASAMAHAEFGPHAQGRYRARKCEPYAPSDGRNPRRHPGHATARTTNPPSRR